MERDYAFEALAEVTSTDWNIGRGELNAALKSIREQSPVFADDNYLLHVEIHERAKLYKQVMGEEIVLTPSALAKHWKRVREQAPKPTYPQPVVVHDGPDGAPRLEHCETCDDHRMVLVGHRKVTGSVWARERGIVPPTHPAEPGHEQWAPCPDCNSGANASFWRADGSRFRPMEAETARTKLRLR